MKILEFLPAILLTFSGIPQTIKLLKIKSSRDISKLTYTSTWIAVLLLTIRSFELRDSMLFFGNSVSMITLTINLFLIFKYANKSNMYNK